MVGEEFRSIAYINHDKSVSLSQTLEVKEAEFLENAAEVVRTNARIQEALESNQTQLERIDVLQNLNVELRDRLIDKELEIKNLTEGFTNQLAGR